MFNTPFADRVCSLPGPINITVKPTVKSASSGIKNILYYAHSVKEPSYQVYDLHFLGGGVSILNSTFFMFLQMKRE